MRTVLRKLRQFFEHTSSPHLPAHTGYADLTDELISNYTFIVGSRFIYFNELTAEQKLRFIGRVHMFLSTKKFHYIGLEEREEIPILVGASVVQVTFGLRNYLLSHFEDIYVLADAYKIDDDTEYYIGHVTPEGIYISWKHFLYGYAVQHDNINVAIHEVAHALLYNNFFAEYGIDTHFRLNYERFSSTTGPILADIITKRRSYLRSYAFSNLHEFWAVSVEAFFENPKRLKLNMPELYHALCTVLNQDPLTTNKILGPIEP
ncbi:MAG: zinc-dependent peptidase [Bacteroidota bacterium]|nr:zinc-dependent peptidase [Bacteroidota bacterium]